MTELNKQKEYAEHLLDKYGTHEEKDIDRLRRLDRKTKRPAEIFAYIYGVAGVLVLGVGMCICLGVIGDIFPLGVVLGVAGIAMMVSTYFIYKGIFGRTKKKHAEEILRLSREMLNEENNRN